MRGDLCSYSISQSQFLERLHRYKMLQKVVAIEKNTHFVYGFVIHRTRWWSEKFFGAILEIKVTWNLFKHGPSSLLAKLGTFGPTKTDRSWLVPSSTNAGTWAQLAPWDRQSSPAEGKTHRLKRLRHGPSILTDTNCFNAAARGNINITKQLKLQTAVHDAKCRMCIDMTPVADVAALCIFSLRPSR